MVQPLNYLGSCKKVALSFILIYDIHDLFLFNLYHSTTNLDVKIGF